MPSCRRQSFLSLGFLNFFRHKAGELVRTETRQTSPVHEERGCLADFQGRGVLGFLS